MDDANSDTRNLMFSDDLIALNHEIAVRETAGDATWFDRLLAPEFVMRRANGVHVTRAVFLAAVERSAARETTHVDLLHVSDHCALVRCVVTLGQGETEKSFENCRMFARSGRNQPWQLLGWANDPA